MALFIPQRHFAGISRDIICFILAIPAPTLWRDSEDIHKIWQMISPLIRAHKLEAIFIEASYPDDRPDKLLFGHLTPRWLLFERRQLSLMVNPQHPDNIAGAIDCGHSH